MLQSLHHVLPTGENRRNAYASLVVLFAFAFYHWNTDPEACGADPVAVARRSTAKLLTSATVSTPRAPIGLPAVPQFSGETSVSEPGSQSPSICTETVIPFEEEAQSPVGTALHGRWALKASQSLLQQGQSNLGNISDYSAQFKRQERINGALLNPQTMNLKVRHAPFSLYMKWTEGDKGRQLIFVEGQNENQVLIQIGGVPGRLTGALPMAPNDPRVLAESRYPATCAGMLELTKIILQHHATDLGRASGVTSEIRDGESFDNRPCFLTTLVYENPSINADYSKSTIFIDKELSVPVCVRNYTWIEGQAPKADNEDSLIEFYSYTGLELNTQLSDNDFEKRKYKMR